MIASELTAKDCNNYAHCMVNIIGFNGWNVDRRNRKNPRKLIFKSREIEEGTQADKVKVLNYLRLNHHGHRIFQVMCECGQLSEMVEMDLRRNAKLNCTWFK